MRCFHRVALHIFHIHLNLCIHCDSRCTFTISTAQPFTPITSTAHALCFTVYAPAMPSTSTKIGSTLNCCTVHHVPSLHPRHPPLTSIGIPFALTMSTTTHTSHTSSYPPASVAFTAHAPCMLQVTPNTHTHIHLRPPALHILHVPRITPAILSTSVAFTMKPFAIHTYAPRTPSITSSTPRTDDDCSRASHPLCVPAALSLMFLFQLIAHSRRPPEWPPPSCVW